MDDDASGDRRQKISWLGRATGAAGFASKVGS